MGKRQFQQKAVKAVNSSSLSVSAATTGNGIHKKHLRNNNINSSSTNVSSVHRGRKRRQQALERQQRKQSFIETELAKIDEIANDKRVAAKRNNSKKGKKTSFKTLGLDLGSVLNQLSNDTRQGNDDDDDVMVGKDDHLQQQQQQKKKQLRHRNWATVVNEERDQMQRVVQHDAFVDMGVDALRAHLTNTVMPSSTSANDVNKTTTATVTKRWNNKKSEQQQHNKVTKRDQSNADEEETQSVAAQRRQFKKRQAEQLLEMGADKRGHVKRQTFGSLLGGVKQKGDDDLQQQQQQKQRRGRIGDKRPKNLT